MIKGLIDFDSFLVFNIRSWGIN